MSSIQGAGSKIKAGLRPLKLAAFTSHPTRPMPTISRPQTASNTTIASPVRPTTSSTRRFSRSTTMTGRTIKYGSGRYATTELSPQPSDDEDDPLNWPLWKKDLNLFALLVTVCLVSAMKTAFIPVAAKLAIQFQVSHTAIASLTAVPFIFSSITGLASVTASKIWGKRPVYLLSMVFLFIGALWNMRSTTFGTTLGARIFQGIGWGAFDTLVLSSIHDTYFEHQRNPRLAAYDILQAATAWGPPLLSGVAMRNAARFEIHFEILNTFFIVAIPLLAFAAPETAYDRWFIGNALPSARTPTWTTARRSIGKFNLHVPNTHEARQYLRTMKPISSFRGFVDNRTLLQGPRALIAPTTALLALATFLPYSALWAIAHVVSPLTAAILDEAQIGFLLLAPFICGVSAAALFAFWRRKARKDFTLLNLVAALGVGTVLAAIGILSFGLEIHGSRNISFKLLSVLAGFLAVGVYVLNALARPVIYRSAQYTSSNLHVCLRNVADMDAGLVCWKNMFAAFFILGVASAVEARRSAGLRSSVIGIGVSQIFVALFVGTVWWFMDERLRRLDGRVMGLVDMGMLKRAGSFFDED
ncbi:hypothetical protein VD0001_g2508 [Verticillium dahliae]|nr:hypothetical protein VD0001_g2508 [Verticillium dahliae]